MSAKRTKYKAGDDVSSPIGGFEKKQVSLNFRNFEDSERQSTVEALYAENRTKQTVAFVKAMHEKYVQNKTPKLRMGMWEVFASKLATSLFLFFC